MSRKVLINKANLMKSAMHKTLHKHNKSWIVCSLLFLAIFGKNAATGHANTTKEQSVNNDKQGQTVNPIHNKDKSLVVNKANPLHKNISSNNNIKSTQQIQNKANNLHKDIINNTLKFKLNDNKQQNTASSNKNKQSTAIKQPHLTSVNEPSLGDSSENSFFKGSYTNKPLMGVNCRVYSNGGLEFTNQNVAESNHELMDRDYNDGVAQFGPKAIKFDPGFNASKMVNIPGIFSNVSSLQYLDFTNFNLNQIPRNINYDGSDIAVNSSDFGLSSVTSDMSNIFSNDANLSSITLPNSFVTPNIKNMSHMFANDPKLKHLNLGSNFAINTSDMSGMFASDNIPLSNALSELHTSHVRNMSGMFENNSNLESITLPSTFDTFHVSDMSGMFARDKNLQSLTLPNSFDTFYVKDISGMFANDPKLRNLNLGRYFAPNASYMNDLFLGDNVPSSVLSEFNTSNAKSMNYMFANSKIKSIALPNTFNTSSVHNMSGMFANDKNLQSLTLPDAFDTSNVYNMSDMFINDNSLQSLTLPSSFNTKASPDVDMYYMLPSNLKKLTISSPSTALSPMAFRALCNSSIHNHYDYGRKLGDGIVPIHFYKELGPIDNTNGLPYTMSTPTNDTDFEHGNEVGTFTTKRHTKLSGLHFIDYSNSRPLNDSDITPINMFINNIDGSAILMIRSSDPDQKFINNGHIVNEVPFIDATENNGTVNVIYQDDGLTYVYNKNNNSVEFIGGTANSDLSDFSKRDRRVRDASSIKFDKGIDMSKATDMNGMFSHSRMLSLDLGNNFNTSNVTNMANMFSGDVSLKLLDGINNDNNFKTSKVTNMSGMFGGDASLKTISLNNNFNTAKVSDMSDMFNGDRSLKSLSLPKSFDMSHVNNETGMIINDNNLNTITINSPKTKLKYNILKYSAYDKNNIPVNFHNNTNATPSSELPSFISDSIRDINSDNLSEIYDDEQYIKSDIKSNGFISDYSLPLINSWIFNDIDSFKKDVGSSSKLNQDEKSLQKLNSQFNTNFTKQDKDYSVNYVPSPNNHINQIFNNINSIIQNMSQEVTKVAKHDAKQYINQYFNNHKSSYKEIDYDDGPVLFYRELGPIDINGNPFTVGRHANTNSDANNFALGNVGTFITKKNPFNKSKEQPNKPKTPSKPNRPSTPNNPPTSTTAIDEVIYRLASGKYISSVDIQGPYGASAKDEIDNDKPSNYLIVSGDNVLFDDIPHTVIVSRPTVSKTADDDITYRLPNGTYVSSINIRGHYGMSAKDAIDRDKPAGYSIISGDNVLFDDISHNVIVSKTTANNSRPHINNKIKSHVNNNVHHEPRVNHKPVVKRDTFEFKQGAPGYSHVVKRFSKSGKPGDKINVIRIAPKGYKVTSNPAFTFDGRTHIIYVKPNVKPNRRHHFINKSYSDIKNKIKKSVRHSMHHHQASSDKLPQTGEETSHDEDVSAWLLGLSIILYNVGRDTDRRKHD